MIPMYLMKSISSSLISSKDTIAYIQACYHRLVFFPSLGTIKKKEKKKGKKKHLAIDSKQTWQLMICNFQKSLYNMKLFRNGVNTNFKFFDLASLLIFVTIEILIIYSVSKFRKREIVACLKLHSKIIILKLF